MAHGVSQTKRWLWQRRYWEHLIRDESDFRAHMDYVHINPLKPWIGTPEELMEED